jgi:hypothetical protein
MAITAPARRVGDVERVCPRSCHSFDGATQPGGTALPDRAGGRAGDVLHDRSRLGAAGESSNSGAAATIMKSLEEATLSDRLARRMGQ